MEKHERSGFAWALALLAFSTAFMAAAMVSNDPVFASAPAGGTAVAAAPNPTAVVSVFLDGRHYPASLQTLDLTGRSVTAQELLSALPDFPDLRRVELPDSRFTPEERAALRAVCPDTVFVWPVTVLGEEHLSTETELSFAGREDLTDASLEELRAAAAEFYDLHSIDLTGPALSGAAVHELGEALGGVEMHATVSLYGVAVGTDDTEIDLSGVTITDLGAEVENALPWFSQLEKVVMCGCGISDEDMDALNRRHDDVRFVWEVYISRAAIRTDADFFITYRASGIKITNRNAGLSALQYCPDLVALDIGHFHTQDISYVANMPHLKYLILAENYVLDLSPLGDLTELKWLEMFQCVTRDISPLLGCTALEDLNICYVSCNRDNLYETLRQMTWLKRLWCSGTSMTRAQIASLREELPDCEIWCRTGDESTGSTWRYSESYYEMRDAFHMYYMDIYGNRTKRLDEEGLQRMHDRFWR